MTSNSHYPRPSQADADPRANSVPIASPSLPAIERAVLASWEAGDTFRKSVEARPAGVRAMLPYVDRFLPVHNLKSLIDLAKVMNEPARRSN